MTIKEVCKRYDVTADTLRYYERVGVIPKVKRGKGGIRQYDEEAIHWVESALFMRKAGVPIEMLVEYVRLFRQGDSTLQARKELLEAVREDVRRQLDKYQETLRRLEYKISRYDEAVRTGVLTWDAAPADGETENGAGPAYDE